MVRPAAFFALFLLVRGGSGTESVGRPVRPEEAWERFGGDSLLAGFRNMYQPEILEVSDREYPFRMWFFGWAAEDCNPGYPGCDAIFHARSRDLVRWEVYCGDGGWDQGMNPARWVPVLLPGESFYDCWHVGDPTVVLKNGTYYMAFSSTSRPGYREMPNHNDGMLLCIRGAVSKDGIHWRKTPHPLLIEPPEVRQATSDAVWIGDFHRPSLMWDGNRWRLWFDYWCGREKGVCMGLAENAGGFDDPGGFRVVHDLNEPLIVNWPNPDVVKAGPLYFSFADPVGYPLRRTGPNALWTSRVICEATSTDGTDWHRVGYLPPDPDVAACHVPQGFVRNLQGTSLLYVFYATQRGGKPVYDYRYDRIRAVRRKIRTPDL